MSELCIWTLVLCPKGLPFAPKQFGLKSLSILIIVLKGLNESLTSFACVYDQILDQKQFKGRGCWGIIWLQVVNIVYHGAEYVTGV